MGPVGEFEEDMPPPVFVLFADEEGSNLSNCCMETLPFTCTYIFSDFSHLKFVPQTIMFSPENHLDTRAASSPRDGSSSTLYTRTLSAFCLVWETLLSVCWMWLNSWRKTSFISTFAKGTAKQDFTEVGTTLKDLENISNTKRFKCLPSTIQVLFGRGRYLVEINIMTTSK